MGNTAIGYRSTWNRPRHSSDEQRHTCCACGKVYALKEPGLIIFHTGNGKDIEFCYHHVLELVNKHDSYLPPVPLRPERFNIHVFLDQVRQNLMSKGRKSSKRKKTVRLINKFLSVTKLNLHVADPTTYALVKYQEI